ncbi:MAG: hypothetical protein WBP81_23950 [Solirubrobacteraceae bacterium]
MTSLLIYQLDATERAINDIQGIPAAQPRRKPRRRWLFRQESVSTIGSSCYF